MISALFLISMAAAYTVKTAYYSDDTCTTVSELGYICDNVENECFAVEKTGVTCTSSTTDCSWTVTFKGGSDDKQACETMETAFAEQKECASFINGQYALMTVDCTAASGNDDEEEIKDEDEDNEEEDS